MNETIINTKYGRARLNSSGHYILSKTNEPLHRKIWEEHYGRPVPERCDIHHLDENKTNNEIWNLKCVKHGVHSKFHKLREGMRKPNRTGYYRVYKVRRKVGKRGYAYSYYKEDGKRAVIQRTNLHELEKVVKEKGLPWFKVPKV